MGEATENKRAQQHCGIQKVPIMKASQAGLSVAQQQMGSGWEGTLSPGSVQRGPELGGCRDTGEVLRTGVKNRSINWKCVKKIVIGPSHPTWLAAGHLLPSSNWTKWMGKWGWSCSRTETSSFWHLRVPQHNSQSLWKENLTFDRPHQDSEFLVSSSIYLILKNKNRGSRLPYHLRKMCSHPFFLGTAFSGNLNLGQFPYKRFFTGTLTPCLYLL